MKLKEYVMLTIAAFIFLMMTGIGKANEVADDKVKAGDTDKLWAMIFSGNLTDDFHRIKSAVNIDEPNNKITTYIRDEWEDTKAFQKEKRAEGQAQLERNKEQISNLFSKISTFFKK